MQQPLAGRRIVFLVTEDWYFWSHRLPLARAARDLGARVIVAARIADHEGRLRAEGFETAHIPFDRAGLSPRRDFATVREITRLYRRVRPDLVHHVAVKPVLFGSLAARLAGAPRIVNAMAGLGFLFTNEKPRTRVLRGVFLAGLRALGRGQTTWTIVQNDDDRAILLRAGLPEARMATIRGSGVDAQAFRPASSEPPGPPVAVCVARMLWDKGVGELVEAARILRDRGVSLRIRLVGGGDLNPASVPPETLANWADEGVVEIAGHSADVAGEYARAHIAVLPSYREGLPKSLLEAAACGLPLVATDVPGCREICRDGDSGLLVPLRDPLALADALARLAADADLRRRLGANARRAVEEEFAQEIVVERTLAIYSRLLDDGTPA
ncbi:MAG: glycosyltransferase family 1 protein [Salinarimonadaceae bacterium]|nr:MAG: glycosyltransferase family 1 protein [Salinarimonadaceae bacterium]